MRLRRLGRGDQVEAFYVDGQIQNCFDFKLRRNVHKVPRRLVAPLKFSIEPLAEMSMPHAALRLGEILPDLHNARRRLPRQRTDALRSVGPLRRSPSFRLRGFRSSCENLCRLRRRHGPG